MLLGGSCRRIDACSSVDGIVCDADDAFAGCDVEHSGQRAGERRGGAFSAVCEDERLSLIHI
eukprot:3476960-Rhodomonas_salina.1